MPYGGGKRTRMAYCVYMGKEKPQLEPVKNRWNWHRLYVRACFRHLFLFSSLFRPKKISPENQWYIGGEFGDLGNA